jgi:ATP-dependent exoDNAse (exonuclease V) alpha subunit
MPDQNPNQPATVPAQREAVGPVKRSTPAIMHERTEIEVASGDKLLMMGNRKEPGFRATNGELTTVRSVERGIINLEDGRSVPANYREFTHGYAVTAHRSQGKTVDHVIVSADVMKQELFLCRRVAWTRGRFYRHVRLRALRRISGCFDGASFCD